MNTSPKSTQSEFAVQETNDSILQRLTTRVRGNSASSYSEMVVVKLADTIGKYKRNRSNVPGVLGDVLVNMGGMPAAVGGFRPKDRISEDDRYGAGLFLRQMSAYIGRESGRSSLSFYEHGNSPANPEISGTAVGSNPPGSNVEEHCDGSSQYEDATSELLVDVEADRTAYPWRDPDTVSIASNYDKDELFQNILNIGVYSREDGRPLNMRALLDTGAGANMMRRELAVLTGFPIRPISGTIPRILFSASGQPIHPLGMIELRWYFNERLSSAKSYDIPFLVCPDTAPYDVVLGFEFLQEARIFKFNESFSMVLVPEDERRARREEEQRRRREEQQRVQRERDRAERERKRREREQRKQGK